MELWMHYNEHGRLLLLQDGSGNFGRFYVIGIDNYANESGYLLLKVDVHVCDIWLPHHSDKRSFHDTKTHAWLPTNLAQIKGENEIYFVSHGGIICDCVY